MDKINIQAIDIPSSQGRREKKKEETKQQCVCDFLCPRGSLTTIISTEKNTISRNVYVCNCQTVCVCVEQNKLHKARHKILAASNKLSVIKSGKKTTKKQL